MRFIDLLTKERGEKMATMFLDHLVSPALYIVFLATHGVVLSSGSFAFPSCTIGRLACAPALCHLPAGRSFCFDCWVLAQETNADKANAKEAKKNAGPAPTDDSAAARVFRCAFHRLCLIVLCAL